MASLQVVGGDRHTMKRLMGAIYHDDEQSMVLILSSLEVNQKALRRVWESAVSCKSVDCCRELLIRYALHMPSIFQELYSKR